MDIYKHNSENKVGSGVNFYSMHNKINYLKKKYYICINREGLHCGIVNYSVGGLSVLILVPKI